jgi:hypothetical protein
VGTGVLLALLDQEDIAEGAFVDEFFSIILTPVSRPAAMMASASARVRQSGFSQTTCLPARAASMQT